MKKGNLILSVIMIAVATFVIIQSSMFPKEINGIPGPGFFPIIISVLLLIASISLIITSLKMPCEENIKIDLLTEDSKRAYISMAVMVIYIIVMPVVGFSVTSFAFLLGMIKWLSSYSWIKCAGVSALAVVLVYVVFNMILNVPLQFGMLF